MFMILLFASFTNKFNQIGLIKKAVNEGEKGDFSDNQKKEMLNEYTNY